MGAISPILTVDYGVDSMLVPWMKSVCVYHSISGPYAARRKVGQVDPSQSCPTPSDYLAVIAKFAHVDAG